MEKVIRTTDELLALRRRGARRGVRRVVLDLPCDDAVQRDAERAINRELRACGCELGSVFVAVAIALTVLRYALGERPSILATITMIFAFALTGKTLGILLAQLRMRAAIRRLL